MGGPLRGATVAAQSAPPTEALPPSWEARSAGRPRPSRNYSQIATLESTLYMRNQLLRDTDWASMAHSLEVRTPLVDAWLLRNLAGPLAAAKTCNHKHLLAGSPAKPLPPEIANRTKSCFTTPISEWEQRGDRAWVWRKVPALAHPNCHWARRWGYTVAATQGSGA